VPELLGRPLTDLEQAILFACILELVEIENQPSEGKTVARGDEL
jgi:hypothetical protein